MIKRIIFDLDNTLIITKSFLEPNKKALERVGIFDIEKARLLDYCSDAYEKEYSSYNRKDFMTFLNKRLNVNLDESFLDILADELKQSVPQNFEAELEVLDYLSKKYELVVLTNYFSDIQSNRLQAVGALKYFISVLGEEFPKPRKEAYIKACGEHKPNECVMIGDNFEYDVLTPRQFGLSSIWITDKEISNGKDIINHLGELKDIF